MLRVAITGSRGFVGKILVNELLKYELEIIEIDLAIGFNILNREDLDKIDAFDVLVHLAAKTYVPKAFEDPASFYYANVMGTLNALELCRKYEARIIFTSSYVYGTPDYLPIDELHPLKAFNPYAQSKIMGEDLCRAYQRDFNIPGIIFRPFNIYGKGQGEQFLIQSIINQAKTGHIDLKDSRPKRDFIHVRDVVDAYIKAVFTTPKGVEEFNLGSGISTSIKELTQIISAYYSNDISIHFTEERRKNEVLETRANVNKAKEHLKWSPTISLETGINKLLDR
jgi:nucleoside-diphosphate-sugar epimerase